MVIPADRSGLLTTSETEKAIALIRNSVNVRDPYQIPSSGKTKSNRKTGAEKKQKFCFLCAPLPEINQKVNKIKKQEVLQL